MSTKINGGTGVDKVDPDIITGLTQTITDNVTGNIVESGSNDNGNYIKWADGTMICAGVTPSLVVTSSNWILPIYTKDINVTFAQTFISAPIVTSGAVDWYLSVGWTSVWQIYIDTARLVIYSGNVAGGAKVTYTAIGRWY